MHLRVPPPVQGIVAAAIIWGVDKQWPQLAVPFPGQRIVAPLLGAVGFAIAINATFSFRKADTTINPMKPDEASELVIEGLYEVTRNPMYLGLLLVLSGWCFWLGNPLGIAAVVLFVWYITQYQIQPEERVLREKFGTAYDEYCQRVRRWI